MDTKPPANGRKLWRVKRLNQNAQPESNTVACQKNSLKIANSTQYGVRKPQLKRPKNKPGMPKDFVFVDLSPVKDDGANDSDIASTTSYDSNQSSPVFSSADDSMSSLNDSVFSDDFDYSDFSFDSSLIIDDYMQANPTQVMMSPEMGLGLMNNWNQPMIPQGEYHSEFHTPRQMSQPQFETPINQITSSSPTMAAKSPKTPPSHGRSKSTSSVPKKKAGGLQFKTYTAPKTKEQKASRPRNHHRHTVSQPIASPENHNVPSKPGLDDFMKLNEQIMVSLSSDNSSGDESINLSTPITDLSEVEEDLQKPVQFDSNLTSCGLNDFLSTKQDEFDLSSFVAL